MNKVKVLIEGYAKELKTGWLASSTVTLVESNGKLTICDPGCNREMLLNILNQEKLTPEDFDYVFLSHGHIDHSLLAGIFSRAKFVTFESLMYDKDLQLEFKDDVLGPGTKVIKTSGHCSEHISLVVDTEKGKYCVAGDVFWWAGGEKEVVDIDKADDAHPSELDMVKLKNSRKTLLELADFIIPGHGKMFKVEK